MLSINTTNQELNLLAITLNSKSKRTLKRGKLLNEQAKVFSPLYRDFVLKIISNKKIKITNQFDKCLYRDVIKDKSQFFSDKCRVYVDKNSNVLLNKKLTKKSDGQIVIDLNKKDALPHELGHAVDFWFGSGYSLTSLVIVKDNKTFKEIFLEEFNQEYELIYQTIMDEYKTIINSSINENAFDILMNNIKKYRKLCSIPIHHSFVSKRQKLQQELYESGFVEILYSIIDKRCFEIINDKYSPILDAISAKYNLFGLGLSCHPQEYYQNDKRIVEEFFANAFEAKVTSKYQHLNSLIKYLPKSFEAFDILFNLFYERLLSNRKFTDLKLKERKSINEI